MSEIKNIHYLVGIEPSTLEKLNSTAAEYKRYSSILFKIIKIKDGDCIIEVKQEKSFYEKYVTQKRLIEIVHETFDAFLPSLKIKVHAVPYEEPVTNIVTPEWIRTQMLEKHVKLKEIAKNTGVDYTQLSANINGAREISQPVKAMFYYYFQVVGNRASVI